MKILIYTPYFYPGFRAGGPIQSLKTLSKSIKSEEFEIFTITSPFDLGEPMDVQTDTMIHSQDYGYIKYLTKKNWIRQYKLIKDIDPDLIYLNSFFNYHFSIKIQVLNFFLKKKVLICPRGELSEGALGIKRRKKSLYLFLFKKFINKSLNQFHAASEIERNDIQNRLEVSGEKIHVASNLKSFNFSKAHFDKRAKEPGHLRIVFLSRISRKKNLHFALEVLSKTPRELTIEFSIYGAIYDNSYWQTCLLQIKELPGNIDVIYKGNIAHEEVVPTLSKYDVFFLPTLGENFGHVIIEAMMAKTPILLSDKTPFNLLDEFNAGYNVPLTDEVAFIKRLTEFALMDTDTLNRKSDGVKKYLLSIKDSITDASRYQELFKKMVTS